jgi:hypothetical protein
MMPIPTLTPPTDNLYKFLAISGLVLTIFCIFCNVYPSSFLAFSDSTFTNLVIDSRKLEIDFEYLKRSIAQQALQSQTTVDEIENQPQVQQQLLDIEHRMIQLDELLEQERRKSKTSETIRQMLFVLSLFGSSMAATGFSLWYSRVQIHQDKLLKIDVASKLNPQNTESKTTTPENELSQSSVKAPEIVSKSQTTSPTHKG